MTSMIPSLWALALSMSASAANLADGQRCLAANDVPCAMAVVEEMNATASKNPDWLAFAAKAHFYAANFEEAAKLANQAADAGWNDRWDDRLLYERTRDVHADWTEAERGSFLITWRPGVDVILLEEAAEVLALSEQHLADKLMGGPPPGPTRLEIYPDGRTFIDASSLTKDDVQTTGVVALSKWSRLLLTSPRALGRGYGWKDTVAHEYIHLVVSHQTDDKTPVWLQEAIAKYLDNRWVDGQDHFHLSVRAQGLLAEAIASDDLVSFEEMHPSFAKLKSADRASLAYAQVSTMMAYCYDKQGDGLLLDVLPRIKDGTDAAQALALGCGFKNYDQMHDGWLEYVRGLDLVSKKLASMPTVLDGGTELDADPVLSHRQDLARFVRLGDLLAERSRYKAAMVEYAKAVPADEPMSPLLANRMAQAWLELGEADSARRVLEDSLQDYPEFPLSHKTLGSVYASQGRAAAALRSYRRAADFNPYDPAVQQALADLSTATGDLRAARRYEDNLRILRRGGEG